MPEILGEALEMDLGTAAIIVSGGVEERMSMKSDGTISIPNSLLVSGEMYRVRYIDTNETPVIGCLDIAQFTAGV